MTRKTFLIS